MTGMCCRYSNASFLKTAVKAVAAKQWEIIRGEKRLSSSSLKFEANYVTGKIMKMQHICT
jgi:hypothetical protein